MRNIIRISLKNGVAVVILSLLVLIAGFYSATQIKQQTYPDVSFPAVLIQVVYPGASTQEIETSVTNPMEDSLMQLKGYDSLTSTSSENVATIFLQYPFGTNMDTANKDIDTIVSKVSLPSQAKVTVQRLSTGAQPIYQAAIFSPKAQSEQLQQKLENEVVPKLEKIPGINSVQLHGTKTQDLLVQVDKQKASRYGVSLSAIQSTIQAQEYALPLGTVTQGGENIPIRLVGKLNSVQQIENLQISTQPAPRTTAPQTQLANNTPAAKVTIKDVATVTEVSSQNEISRFNGQESYVISVLKNQDANTAEVANEVKTVLKDYQEQGQLDLHVVMDQGKEIETSVSSLIREGLFGALFTVVVIFLFLRNIRATLISIISLPISIFATISILHQMGYTLNIMTLGGMAVAVGRIVDDSIVVIENIYRWKQEHGEEYTGKKLAFLATQEVVGAVSSSTIATLVVFLPLGFVSGIIGEFFRPFSLAVTFSILTSLLVAMMLIPVLGSSLLKKVKPHSEEGRIVRGFEKILRGALKHKGWVLGLSVLLWVGSLGLIPLLGVSFLPTGSQPTAQITLTLPGTSSLDQTDRVSKDVEKYIQGMKNLDYYQVSVGGGGSQPFVQSATNKATYTLQFHEGTVIADFVDQTNRDLASVVSSAVPGTKVNMREFQQEGPPSGNNVEVDLYSPDLAALAKAAGQVETLMVQSPQLKDVTNSLKEMSSSWVLTLNQAGMDAGLSSFQVMQAVNEQLKPLHVGVYTVDGKKMDLNISYKQAITSKEQLENIELRTMTGVKKLKDVAQLEQLQVPVTINHQDGKSYAKVTGVVKGTDTAKISQQIQTEVNQLSLPSGVNVSFGGGLAMITEGFSSLGIAMGAAVGLVFLVMSMTFGGLLTPFVILTSLLFVPIGALTGLLISGQTLSMSAMIGMLMLVGIVVTNAVVLLDRVETNRKQGKDLTEAIVEASKTRLRPIVMTASATILALIPLAFSHSSSSLISQGLAITVIGGLTTSTLLTLIVVPVIYQLIGKYRKLQKEETF